MLDVVFSDTGSEGLLTAALESLSPDTSWPKDSIRNARKKMRHYINVTSSFDFDSSSIGNRFFGNCLLQISLLPSSAKSFVELNE